MEEKMNKKTESDRGAGTNVPAGKRNMKYRRLVYLAESCYTDT